MLQKTESFTLGSPLRRHTSLATIIFVAIAAACDSSQRTATGVAPGSLAVVIAGLSAGAAGAVSISGPNGYLAQATATETLTPLTPGDYRVDASTVTVEGTSLVPSPPSQSVAVASGSTATATVTYAASTLTIGVQRIVQGLTNPVYLTAPAGDARLFIVEQPGRIRIVKNGQLLPTPFLDITSIVNYGGERGLLSVAFDPQYATNGRFFVYYTGTQGDIMVDRYTVSSNADVANTAAERVITIPHRAASNHNGGLLMFGPDGMLYLGTGDGGGAGDQPNNSQNLDVLLGKLLRLDVSTLPYTVPPNNPFVNKTGADEIWAYGLRNPWRYAFDGSGSTAQLYIADVGQGAWEEVNVVDASTPGLNYGWRIMEGTHCYNPSSNCITAGLRQPVLEYDHSQGCSITGGFVYRGAALPEMRGHYFYSDYCSGWLRSFRYANGAAVDQRSWPIGNIGSILSFGVDGAGEHYMLSSNGGVYRIVRQ